MNNTFLHTAQPFVISAQAALIHIQSGLRGSITWKIFCRERDDNFAFYKATFNPAEGSIYALTNYTGKYDLRHHPEMSEAINLIHQSVLKHRQGVKKEEIADCIHPILRGVIVKPEEVFEEIAKAVLLYNDDNTPKKMLLDDIHEKLAFLLRNFDNSDVLTIREKRQKRDYQEQRVGQWYIQRLGGMDIYGAELMQKEIDKFKGIANDYKFTLFFTLKKA